VAAPQTLTGLRPVFVQNRKFIGSKQNLLDFIDGVASAQAPDASSMADLFCGSGVVAHHFAAKGMAVIASDTLYHNWIASQCFLGGRPGAVNWSKISLLLERLDSLSPIQGYCFHEFGGSYFTSQNAGRIDAIREAIDDLVRMGGISDQERAILLTSLIYAADKVANTCGQYDAFLKHLGASPYSAEGVHRVDATVYKPLELGLPQVIENGRCQTYCDRAETLIDQVSADILYLDPPYNSRQYVDNYHVLENIARWEKPELFGKTRKFSRDHLKSPYSMKRQAQAHLEHLVKRARTRHILLSYSTEGIIPDQAILEALQQRGATKVFTQEYGVFGNGAGRSRRRTITERIFYCQVTEPPISC
jgi:adenine-specific DNA-methyltransferase